jgi:hypothetical protein
MIQLGGPLHYTAEQPQQPAPTEDTPLAEASSSQEPRPRVDISKTQPVGDEGKNGLITAIGIVLGFVLGFYTQWAFGEDPWRSEDIIPTLLYLCGIAVLIISLYNALIPYKQTVKHYERTVRIFILGVTLFGIAFLVSLVIEIWQHQG